MISTRLQKPPRTHGPTDPRTHGPTDLRTYGPTDLRTHGPTDLRTHGPTDPRTYGPTDLRTHHAVLSFFTEDSDGQATCAAASSCGVGGIHGGRRNRADDNHAETALRFQYRRRLSARDLHGVSGLLDQAG